MICERVLEEEGVKGDITIGNYAMDWIPCEDDLISMELDPSTWKEIYLVREVIRRKEIEIEKLKFHNIGRRSNLYLLCSEITYATSIHLWFISSYYW